MRTHHHWYVIPVLLSLLCGREKSAPLLENNSKQNAAQDFSAHCDLFSAKAKHDTLHDWAKIYFSESNYCEIALSKLETIQKLLNDAYIQQIAVRIRGRGHSMNGSSLPRKGELLLYTDHIRHYQLISPSEIIVGSGISILALQQWLGKRGYTLPIFNDGILAPSVGGYISASGIGTRSVDYGGFWENVTYIKLIDAQGTTHTVKRSDPDFKWIFGSMGQFGLIYEAGLKILATGSKPFTPSAGIITESWKDESEAQSRKHEFKKSRLIWFSVIAPDEKRDELHKDMQNLKKQYLSSIRFLPEYLWPIRNFNFTPPLFYPENKNLICIGIWGYANPQETNLSETLLKLNDEVFRLIQKKTYYKRYIQAEPVRLDTDWKKYWGDTVYNEFMRLRTKYNPKGNVNPLCFENCSNVSAHSAGILQK